MTYSSEVMITEATSHLVAMESAGGDMHQAAFILRALAPGTISLWVNATGEVMGEGGGGCGE
ncbi:MAG: hypothetical protein JW726_16820 [Anaerolineales bacterium]|nr:hypothetical protein [Anaerolineales bacterium]